MSNQPIEQSSLIKINNMNIISSWTFIMNTNTDCTICRQSLNSPGLYALEKGNPPTLNLGICGHMFHVECIKPWLRQNNKCPICSKPYGISNSF
jgi:RING-box protein 1